MKKTNTNTNDLITSALETAQKTTIPRIRIYARYFTSMDLYCLSATENDYIDNIVGFATFEQLKFLRGLLNIEVVTIYK